MSFPDAFAHDIVLGPDQVLPTVPRDFGERFTLNWKAARAPDKSYFYETRMSELWDDALDQLQKATGQTFANPFTLAPAQSVSKLSPAGVVIDTLQRTLFGDRQKGIDAALKAFDQAREGQFDLPDPRRFEDRVRAESVKLRQDAEKSALASYGAGGLGAFLGAAAGELSHPVNIATLPLGGEYAIANVARMGLLKFLGRNALVEGGVAAVSQTAIEAMDAPIQERLATDTGIGDRVERVLTAGVGGAILGLGLSGLVAAVRGARFRGRMALDEADALKVAERNVYAAERNPLGPDGINAHAKALDTAEVQVSAGRHADVREEVRFRDEPAPAQPGRGDLWRATPEQLQKMLDEKNLSDREKLVLALGEDGANEFERLQRAADSTNAKKADAAAARLAEIEDKLTPDQQRLVYGFGETDLQADEIKRLLDVHDHLKGSENEFVGWFATRGLRKVKPEDILAVPQGGASIDAQAAFVGMMRGWEELTARGMTNDEVARAFVRGMIDLAGMERDDAADFVGSFLERARASRELPPKFDLLDSAAATRPIADAAPVPPEKPPAGMKEAKADEARAMVLQKDFEISMPDGTKRLASEVMAEADEKVKAAKLAAECAAGGAI